MGSSADPEVGTGGLDLILENQKWLLVSLEILVRTPSRTKGVQSLLEGAGPGGEGVPHFFLQT